jgi:NADPH:quinone reductase-like Zn-dependent oxidoreductase
MQFTTLLVNRANITDIRVVAEPAPGLAAGHVRLEIEKFALTANNVTYAAAGDTLKYWHFFPAEDGWGKVPVWGIGKIVDSDVEDLSVGERFFGYFPPASHLDVMPNRISAHGFTDATAHRSELPPIYNRYLRLTAADNLDDDLEDRLSLLRPLYATSFLLHDFMIDNDWFGAEQIIVSSASSKTSIGLLSLAKQQGPKVVGLTSSGNVEFVKGLGICDQIVEYGNIDTEINQVPSVYVDIAGNSAATRVLHERLQDQLKHSAGVGTSHWDKFAPTGGLAGPKPMFFFAPSQSEKRLKEWGPQELEKRIQDCWRDLALESRNWMNVEHHDGADNAMAIYSKVADGSLSPSIGVMISLSGR